MSNVRVEYLFPNIENKRKLKWLENASFIRSAADHEIVNFSLEDYLYRFRRENIKYSNNADKDITEEVNNERYANWRKQSQNNLFSLDGENIRFDNSIVSSLAEHLASHPLEIPYFLEQNAINIIGLFLGESILFSNMILAPSFHYQEYELCHAQKKSEEDYRRKNFEAKYKLSLFLSVIDELLKRGINLEEFSFVDLRDCSTYQETKDTSLWNQKLVETMDVSSYRRCDGQSFNREEMLSFISFSTLSEFLTCIMNLVEVEYYVNFIEDAVTMNPDEVVALPPYRANFSFIAKEDLVSVKELCERFQYKLKTCALETEVIILKRKLAELQSAFNVPENISFDHSELRRQIEALYQEILSLTKEKQKELIQVLKQILESNNLTMDLEEDNNPLESSDVQTTFEQPNDSSKKSSSSTLEEKVAELSRKVENLEKRVSSLENILKEYLDHGGVIPNLDNANMSREEIIAFIKEYRPTTIGAFFRKIELLKKLKVGLIATLVGGMLFISGSMEDTLKEIDSPKLTPMSTEQVVTPNLPEIIVPVTPPATPSLPEELKEDAVVFNLKPVEEIVLEVIRGNWKNGEERKEVLEQNGYDFDYIQEFVNKVIEENVPINQLRPIEEIVEEVANGKWGEGEEAEARLTRVGFDYQVIQKLIDELVISSVTYNPQK